MEMQTARTSDPVTSHIAGENFAASGKCELHYEKILDAMHHVGIPMTAAEIATVCDGLDRYQVARRLPEMERNNLVDRVGRLHCAVLRSECFTWRAK